MKILFLTRYSKIGPSSRYRCYQYFENFSKHNIVYKVSPFFSDSYLKRFSSGSNVDYVSLLFDYVKRFFVLIIIAPSFDIVYIEKECFPYLPGFAFEYLNLFSVKTIIDYDDATFHNYDSNKIFFFRTILKSKIGKIISKANIIITGSPYLTEYCKKFNTNVIEIPTSIEVSKYDKVNIDFANPNQTFSIGWIGSKTTSKNLLLIKESLERFTRKYNAKLIVIGFDQDLLHELNSINMEFHQWNENDEIKLIKGFDLGIMPLIDDPFNHGKCGFKLIQYMACFKPTISSPMEANLKIGYDCGNLFALNNDDWYDAFVKVYSQLNYYNSIVAENNYRKVVKFYSVENNTKIFINLFKSLLCVEL